MTPMKGDGLGLDCPGSTQAFALKSYVTVDNMTHSFMAYKTRTLTVPTLKGCEDLQAMCKMLRLCFGT